MHRPTTGQPAASLDETERDLSRLPPPQPRQAPGVARSFDHRLALLLGAVILLLGGTSGWSAWHLRALAAGAGRMQVESEAVVLTQELRATLLLQMQALKNTWLRGHNRTDYERFTGEFADHTQTMRTLRLRLGQRDAVFTSDEREALTAFDQHWTAYVATWPRALAAYGGPDTADVRAADHTIRGLDRAPMATLHQLGAHLQERSAAAAERWQRDAERSARISTRAAGTGLVLAAAGAALLGRQVDRRQGPTTAVLRRRRTAEWWRTVER